MVDKEMIGIWRNELKSAISSWLLRTNYEGMGEQDKEEFERDFDEILDLALIGLKYKAQLSQEDTTPSAADVISRQAALDEIRRFSGYLDEDMINRIHIVLKRLPSAQPEITHEQAIDYLQNSGWMQNHDKQMYEMGLREQLADDSGSHDALLPPAQQARTEMSSAEDLISRQAPTDAITAWLHKAFYPLNRSEYNEGEIAAYETALSELKKIPPAQPEIIRCKDCRYGVDYYHDGDCYCSNPKCELRYFGGSWEFYCAAAERRTDG